MLYDKDSMKRYGRDAGKNIKKAVDTGIERFVDGTIPNVTMLKTYIDESINLILEEMEAQL